MSFFDPEIIKDPYGQLNPEQIKLNKSIGPYLQNAAMNPATMYSGTYAAPLTQGEQDLITQNSRLNALSEPTWQTLMNPLDTSGEMGSALNNYYNDSIYKPLMKQYQEDVQPQIEEQYAGSGGYWGGARADAVRRGYRDLQDTLAAKRSELAYNALTNAGTAANQYADYATKSAAIQAAPRIVQQYGLDKQYAEWVRTRPESLPYINWALNFLGLSTGTATQESSTLQKINDIVATGGNIASMGMIPSQIRANNAQANFYNSL